MELLDLKEKLKQALKEKYGLENEVAILNAAEESAIDLGIFVTPYEEAMKSA